MEISSLMWLSPEIIWASSASNVSNGGDVEQHTAQRHGKAVEDVILKVVIDFLLHNADDLRRIGLTVLHQARKRR